MENLSLVEKAERFDRLVEIFEGTLFDGLLEIREEDFIDSDLELHPDEEVEDELDTLERMIHTLTMQRRGDIEKNGQDIGIDLETLYDIYISFLTDRAEEIVDFENQLRKKFTDSGKSFPEDDWYFLLDDIDDFIALGKIMSHCVSSRRPDAEDSVFVIKSGFSVVTHKKPKETDVNFNPGLIWKSFFQN